MAVPTKRDPDVTRRVLAAWLRTRAGADDVEIGAMEIPAASGFSNETLVFDATLVRGGDRTVKSLVARVPPTDYAVFPEYDMSLQYRCMEVVAAHSDVPVPGLVGIEADASLLGQPFYVMDKVEGQVAGDNPPYVAEGWVKDATPEQQAMLYRSSLEAMASIAAIDITTADVSFLDRPDYGPAGVLQQVAYYDMALEWALQGRESAVVDAASRWLHDNAPADAPPNVMNWGDTRPGNILYRDFRPVAVLDWEMAAIGPAEVDLGYWLMFQTYHQWSCGVPRLPGFLDREATIELYGELVGRPMRDVEYYEMFAWYRFAMVLVRISDQFVESGVIPPDMGFAFTSEPMRALADRLGMATPAG